MHLTLLIGLTGTGKTDHATALARTTGAPIITMDRVRLYPELATGSARPVPPETAGTLRYYLDARPVGAGELTADAGCASLARLLTQLAADTTHCILEGGSISLWQEVVRQRLLRGYPVRQVIYRTVRDHAAYQQRLRPRVAAMVAGQTGQPSIVTGLAALWADPRAAWVCERVVGYDVLTTVCAQAGCCPDEIAEVLPTNPTLHEAIIGRITDAHLAYGVRQQAAFNTLVPELQRPIRTLAVC